MPKIRREGGATNNWPDVDAQAGTEVMNSASPTERFRSGEVRELPAFLNWLAEAGHLKRATRSSYRTAVGQFLALVDHEANSDVRALDVDEWCQVFARTRDDLATQTLDAYQNRFRTAVELYRSWLLDPQVLPLPAERRQIDAGRQTAKVDAIDLMRRVYDLLAEAGHDVGPNPWETTARSVSVTFRDPVVNAESELVPYPFPLADGRLAHLALPNPLPRTDAERLSQFVLSLAPGSADTSVGEQREPPPSPKPEPVASTQAVVRSNQKPSGD
jgi:hypothetical protein